MAGDKVTLSPRISSKTMNRNGGLAFGAALAGGALFRPMGAFMALPVAALVVAFFSHYRHAHEVVYESQYADSAAAQDSGSGGTEAPSGAMAGRPERLP